MSIHFGMAIALQMPELQLHKEESEEYAKAVASVARHYDLGASAKTLDWINLGATMASIYGVRAMAIAQRRKAPRTPPPSANGFDPTPAPEATPADQGQAGGIDWSLMTGGRPH
jgi:hypothetical protein